MTERPRLYGAVLRDHLERHRQMALVSGPRQVGKTIVCRSVGDEYLNYDNADDRRALLRGPAALAVSLGLDRLRAKPPVAVLDELHKHAKWKQLLKGFFDTYGDKARLIVTGSSRLDVFRRGGDSLMGRYFLYRMHPWSVGESLRAQLPEGEIQPPAEIASAEWEALWEHGGFPEPFLRRDSRFTRRWRSLRREQLAREDLRDVSQVQDLRMMETLMLLLAERSGQQLVYSNLAQEIGVAVDTVRRWATSRLRPERRMLSRRSRACRTNLQTASPPSNRSSSQPGRFSPSCSDLGSRDDRTRKERLTPSLKSRTGQVNRGPDCAGSRR
jgi:predicted AAA+ superfamily ATPase